MKFLITNDDGFDAPGLAALYRALRPLGEITVVAPATCHSSRGHAVDTKNPIRLEQRNVEGLGKIHVVHSTPADCIRVGLCHLKGQRPDFVVAGINPGANLGVDLFYSGTAAAARESALLGVPAIAVSRLLHSAVPIHWERLSEHVHRVLKTLVSGDFALPTGHFWNVNFPTIDGDHHPDEITIAPQGTEPHAVAFEVVETNNDSEILAYTGVYRNRGRTEQCDIHHVFSQRITATPVGPDLTSGWSDRLQLTVSLADATCAD